MSQDIFSDIDPAATSGTQLATTLNNFKDAIASGMTGTSRPPNLQAGGGWIDTTDDATDLWYYKVFDGTDDILIFTINTATNSVSVTGSSDTFQVTKTSDDAVGAFLTLKKARIAASGQVLDGDVVGEIRFNSTLDSGADEITCRIRSVATDDATVSASGSYLTFECTPDTEGAIEEMMRLVDNKLGIGTVDPETELHTKGNLGIKHERETDDANPAIIAMEKKRLSGDGAVDNLDSISQLNSRAKSDDANIVEVAQIETTATEDHTATNKGSQTIMRTIDSGTAVLTEKLKMASVSKLSGPWETDAPVIGAQSIATAATIAALDTAKHLVNMTGATETNVQGILSTGNSKVILIHNDSTADIILNHENVTATAADRLTLPEDTDVVVSPQASVELFYSTTDSRWKLRSGTGTGGGGVSGGLNYFDSTSSVIEKTIGAWETDDGLGSASAGLTLSVTDVVGELLTGDNSLKLVKDAADRTGHFMKVGSTAINPSDRGRANYGSFEFRPGTGYVNSDLVFEVYDVTNAAVLYSGTLTDLELLNSKGRFNWVTYLEDTTALVEFRVKVDNTNTNTFDAFFDDFKFGPAVQLVAPYQRQETIDLTGSGAFTGGEILVSRIGNIVSIHTSIVPTHASSISASSAVGLLPEWARPTGASVYNMTRGGSSIWWHTVVDSAGTFSVTYKNYSGTDTASTGTGQLTVSYPVATTTSVVNTNELSLQTIRAAGRGNANTVLTGGTTDIDFIETSDSHGAWNGTQFQAPNAGHYTMRGVVRFSATSGTGLYAYIGGVQDKIAGAKSSVASIHEFMWEGYLEKDEILSLRPNGGATLSNISATHWIEISSKPDFTTMGVVKNKEERLVANSGGSLVTYPHAANSQGDLTSLDLPEGTWDLTAVAVFKANGAVTTTDLILAMTSNSGNDATGQLEGDNRVRQSMRLPSQSHESLTVPNYEVVINAPTTYYLKAYAGNSVANLQVAYRISARRIK